MKQLSIVLLFCLTTLWADNAPSWLDFNEARQLAKKDKHFIYLDLYADWCMPCKVMEKTTFSDSRVIRVLNENFHPVQLNIESENEMSCNGKQLPIQQCVSEIWGLSAIPASVIVGPRGFYLLSMARFLSSEEMLFFLQDVSKAHADLIEYEKTLDP